MTDNRNVENITTQEGAALFLSWLQANGAICSIDVDGFLHVDLNPVAGTRDQVTAEKIAAAVLALSEELKALLLAEKVVH